jgi:hypothetical protein
LQFSLETYFEVSSQADAISLSGFFMGVISNRYPYCYSFAAITTASAGAIHEYGIYPGGRVDDYASAPTSGIAGVGCSGVGSDFYCIAFLPAIYPGCK